MWGEGLVFSYDLTTDIGKVRLNIPDTNVDDPAFDDEELQAFLNQEQNNIFFATADALNVLASNQVYILKVRTTGDLSVDGAAVSAELRARAASMRAQGQQANGSTTISTGVTIVRNHRMLRGY